MVYDHAWNERKEDIYVGKRACDGDGCVRVERARKIELSHANTTSLRRDSRARRKAKRPSDMEATDPNI